MAILGKLTTARQTIAAARNDAEEVVMNRSFGVGARVVAPIVGAGTVVTWAELWKARNRTPYRVHGKVPIKFDDERIGYAHAAPNMIRLAGGKVFQDADGYLWDELADATVKLRKFRPDVTPNYTLSFVAADEAYVLTEIPEPGIPEAVPGGVL